MEHKTKVGILTLFHGNQNWGGVLQGYALKYLLESKFSDVKADILIYNSNVNIVYGTKLKQALQYGPGEILNRVIKKLEKRSDAVMADKLQQREKLFREFMDVHKTNPTVYGDDNLVQAAEKYDLLIVGSDQVWNPNVARGGYFLSMIPDGMCKKVAYAASVARDDLSAYEQKVMIPLIEKFDMVSVREKTAKTFLDKYLQGRKIVEEVLDPALLMDRKDWEKLIGEEKKEEDYAVAFFFSESLTYRKKIEKYCKDNNLRLKFIPFAKGEWISSDLDGEYEEKVYDIGPVEFVRLFHNAKCVFTDSFHGSVFSILFEKPFCIFERDKNTKVSKNSRLYDLLEKFELSDCLVRNLKDDKDLELPSVDYENVNRLLNLHRGKSMEFLKNAFEDITPKCERKITKVDELDKSMCCGCGLCAAICPKQCIRMENDEEGFRYPVIDNDLCISCGLCLKKCELKVVSAGKNEKAYLAYNKADDIRRESSSGGIFYEAAKFVIEKGGVVYGAAFDEKFGVVHKRAENLDELTNLMKSKYVQSNIEKTFYDVENDLKSGLQVLFSGTPCQAGAVCEYIKSDELRKN